MTAVESSADGAVATLTDGSTKSVDLLVGADGLDSTVRTLAFGDGYRVDRPYVLAACKLPASPSSSRGQRDDLHRPWSHLGIMNLGDAGACASSPTAAEDPDAELGAGVVASLRQHFSDVTGGGAPESLDRSQAPHLDGVLRPGVSQIVMPRWRTGHHGARRRRRMVTRSLFAGYGGSLALHGAQALRETLAGSSSPSEIPPDWRRGNATSGRGGISGRRRPARVSATSRADEPDRDPHERLMVRAMLLPGVRGAGAARHPAKKF